MKVKDRKIISDTRDMNQIEINMGVSQGNDININRILSDIKLNITKNARTLTKDQHQ